MAREAGLSLVMPTVGRSTFADAALAALRAELDGLGRPGELLVVAQGEAAEDEFPAADRVLRERSPLGFAAANNRGFAASRFAVIGTVNDDAVVEPGFCARLLACMAEEGAASVQGLNWQLAPGEAPERVDGAGIGFNAWWQAVQLGHGEPAGALAAGRREIFGVSATAALYRYEALAAVALGPSGFFDERLITYYEDVDLAIRLRAGGFRAWLEPAARARHAGSASASTLRFAGRALIYGNRHLVLARLLGRAYWWRLPRLLTRDLIDLARSAGRGDGAGVAGVAAGWARAARHLGGYLHLGAPAEVAR